MKVSKQFIVVSIAAISFLSACNGFKSKIYTDAEIAAYQKSLQKHGTPVTPLPTDQSTTASSPYNTGHTQSPKAISQPSQIPGQGDSTKPATPAATPADIGAANTKMMAEAAPIVANLLQENTTDLAKVNPELSKYIRGISIDAGVLGDDRGGNHISVQALIVVGGLPTLLSAQNAELTFYKEGKVPQILVTLQKDDTAKTAVKDDGGVVLTAVCTKDETCAEVQVRLVIQDGAKVESAVFMLTGSRTMGYVITQNNMSEQAPLSYTKALDELNAAVAASTNGKGWAQWDAKAPAKDPKAAASSWAQYQTGKAGSSSSDALTKAAYNTGGAQSQLYTTGNAQTSSTAKTGAAAAGPAKTK